MPVNVGRVLILRGVSGSSSDVEEVQECALRSEAGNSVVEYVSKLLLHYGSSLRRGEIIAPFVSSGVNKLAAAVRAHHDQIRGRCPGVNFALFGTRTPHREALPQRSVHAEAETRGSSAGR